MLFTLSISSSFCVLSCENAVISVFLRKLWSKTYTLLAKTENMVISMTTCHCPRSEKVTKMQTALEDMMY